MSGEYTDKAKKAGISGIRQKTLKKWIEGKIAVLSLSIISNNNRFCFKIPTLILLWCREHFHLLFKNKKYITFGIEVSISLSVNRLTWDQ